MTSALLEVSNLRVSLPTAAGPWTALGGASLCLGAGETVGLVGESGSGKSTLARSILRLLPAGSSIEGSIQFDGMSVLDLSPRELMTLRAQRISMVFQDPVSHLNPVRSVGDFLTEGLRLTGRSTASEAQDRCAALLTEVGLTEPERIMSSYPHQLSGGLLQRATIAAALASEPALLIADEPTTALDVTSQARVLAMLGRAIADRGLAMLFITHDLDVAATMCDRIAVLYAGQMVEVNAAEALVAEPRHPYTAALLAARPSLTGGDGGSVIPGQPISAGEAGGNACPFADRCRFAIDECRQVRPPLAPTGSGGSSACLRSPSLCLESGKART